MPELTLKLLCVCVCAHAFAKVGATDKKYIAKLRPPDWGKALDSCAYRYIHKQCPSLQEDTPNTAHGHRCLLKWSLWVWWSRVSKSFITRFTGAFDVAAAFSVHYRTYCVGALDGINMYVTPILALNVCDWLSFKGTQNDMQRNTWQQKCLTASPWLPSHPLE